MEKLPAHAPVVVAIRATADAYKLPASLLAAATFGDACLQARHMQGNPHTNPSSFAATFRLHKMVTHIMQRDGAKAPMKADQQNLTVDLYKIAVYNCRTVLKAAAERQSGTACSVKTAAMDMVRMAQEATIQIVREDRRFDLFPAMQYLNLALSSGKPITDTNLVRSMGSIMKMTPCSSHKP